MNDIKYKSIVEIEPNSKTVYNYMMTSNGWQKCDINMGKVKEIVYLGKCRFEGDLFAVYYKEHNVILIWKGIKGHEFNK